MGDFVKSDYSCGETLSRVIIHVGMCVYVYTCICVYVHMCMCCMCLRVLYVSFQILNSFHVVRVRATTLL